MANQPQPSQSREQKRAQFSEGHQPKRNNKTILIIAGLAVAALVAYLVIGRAGDQPASSAITADQKGSSATGASADIRIPIADLASGKAKFFDYSLSSNKPVRFFAIKSTDGAYRAALDACDMCYHAKKGYRQEGDNMVCNNCGLKFHSTLINEVAGGCNPVGLPRTVEGDHVVIKASDLESRGGYF